MADMQSPVTCDFKNIELAPGSTDMGIDCQPLPCPAANVIILGNVSYECPGFHGWYGISATATNHTPEFTAAAATDKAHDNTIVMAKGMAVAAWNILTNDAVAEAVQRDFEEDDLIQTVKKDTLRMLKT